jgi:hypothetical protein
MQIVPRTLSGLGDFPTSYDDAVAQWKTAAADFASAYSEFAGNQAQAAADPDTWDTWQTLNSRAQNAQAGIRDIAGQLQAAGVAVGNFFDSAGNLVANAVEAIFGLPKITLQGLGIAPLVIGIGIASVIGATAYLGGVIADLVKFNGVMSQARSQGASPAQTAALLSSAGVSSTSLFGGISNVAGTVLLIGAALYLLPLLLKKRGRH